MAVCSKKPSDEYILTNRSKDERLEVFNYKFKITSIFLALTHRLIFFWCVITDVIFILGIAQWNFYKSNCQSDIHHQSGSKNNIKH